MLRPDQIYMVISIMRYGSLIGAMIFLTKILRYAVKVM